MSDLEFIADSLILDKLATIYYGLEESDGKIVKSADILGTVSGYISSWAKETFDTSSPGAFAESLVELTEPILLSGISPILGVLDSVVQTITGASLTSLIISALKPIAAKIKEGHIPTADEVNRYALSTVGGSGVTASLELLREIEKQGKLVQFVKSAKGNSLLSMLTNLIKPGSPNIRGKTFVGGIVSFVIKCILKGVGLSLLTHSVVKGLGGEPKSKEEAHENGPTVPALHKDNIPYMPQILPNTLKSSGVGEEEHPNDATHVWNLPIPNSIKDSLVNWAKQIYPELDGHDQEIKSSQAFNRINNILNNFLDAGYLRVPQGFDSRKQLVDTFAGEVENKLKG